MRCPHCAGECPDDAVFCGICGHRISGAGSQGAAHGGAVAAAGNAPGLGADVSMSLFDLPVSRGARAARIGAVVVLNIVLAGAGVAMIASYFRDRAAVLERFETAPGEAGETGGQSGGPAVDIRSPIDHVGDHVGDDVGDQVPVPDAPATGSATSPPTREKNAAPTPRAAREKSGARKSPARAPSSSGAARPPANSAKPVTPDKTTETRNTGAAGDGTLGSDPRDHEVVAEQPSPEEVIRSISARVGRVVDRHRVQLQKCYQQAAKTEAPGAPLSGRIEVRFAIMPDGTASDVSVPVNTSGSDRLADCVSASVAGWALPIPGDEPVVLQWPFVFTAPATK